MTTFPRSISGTAILPAFVSEFAVPGPLITKTQSGRVFTRATQQAGRTWRETYRLNVSLTAHKNFLAQVRNFWRNGTAFDIAHVDYATLKGAGGGSPIVQAATQLTTLPENFAGWSAGGTPVLTSGQSDPFGGTAAYLIEDNDAGVAESVSLTVAFTGNATKAFAIYLKAGTAAITTFRIQDNTAVVTRAQVRVTWTAGVPALSLDAGAGALYLPEQHPIYTTWYRIPFDADGIVAANTNQIQLFPASTTSASTGTVYAFGANAWNEVSPARYSGPSQPDNDAIGNVLYSNGATASVSNWLRAGDQLSWVGASGEPVVHEATADVSTQANGYAPIPINPPLYTGHTPADNAAITITGVVMRAKIVEPPTWPDTSGDSNNAGELTLTFAESL